MFCSRKYTWRHDNIVRYIENVDTSKVTVYADIPGYKTGNGGTIPAEYTITTNKPDIVIEDKKNKTIDVFELTVPFESNIKSRNTYKNNHYAYLLTDITEAKPSVTAFEIGVRGSVTAENKVRLQNIHKYCNKNIKFTNFMQNISTLATNSSYYIFTCRKEPTWSMSTPLKAPF